MAQVTKYVTPPFILSFPQLFEPSSFDGGPPKYGLSAIWTPADFTDNDKERMKQIRAALDEAAKSRFKMPVKDFPQNFKRGLRDGREKMDLEGYGDGKWFANITTKMRPGVVGLDKQPIGPEHGNADLIFPGCCCRATVCAYSYDNKGKGVALGLMNVQFIHGRGPRLDSRTDAAEDFGDEGLDQQWLDQAAEAGDDFLDDAAPF